MSCAFGAGVQDAGGFGNLFVGSLQALGEVSVSSWKEAFASPPYRPHNRVERLQDW
jgi:hypothetical protein